MKQTYHMRALQCRGCCQADKAAWDAAKAAVDEEADLAAMDNADGLGQERRELVLSNSKQRCAEAGVDPVSMPVTLPS